MPRGGKRQGAGNPGYGKLQFVKKKVEEHTELWWKEWKSMMESKPDEFINDNVKEILHEFTKKGMDYEVKEIVKELAKGAFYRKQFAMSEFNKLQIKMMPTEIKGPGEGGEFKFDFVGNKYDRIIQRENKRIIGRRTGGFKDGGK